MLPVTFLAGPVVGSPASYSGEVPVPNSGPETSCAVFVAFLSPSNEILGWYVNCTSFLMYC